MPGPGVGHLEHRSSAGAARRTTRADAVGGVCARTFESRLSTSCRRRSWSPITKAWTVSISSGRSRLCRIRAVSDQVRNHAFEIDFLVQQRPAVVQMGEENELVDHDGHPFGFPGDAVHRALEIVGPMRCAAREQLRIGAHGGQWRPQLVRRVGDEAPQLLFGRLPRPERRLDLGQHRVQRMPEAPDLGRVVISARCRLDRSPPAIAEAVSPISSSGRRPRRTTQSPSTTSANKMPTVTRASTISNLCSVLSTPVSGAATRA